MVSRDVDLIIRARDQARNTLNGITQALERFTGSQEGVQQQSAETDSAIDRLGASLRQLRTQLSGENVASRLSGEVSRARQAFENLQRSSRETTGEAIRYTAESRKAARVTAELRGEHTRLAGTLERERASLQAVGISQRQANSILSSLRTRYTEVGQAVTVAANQQRRLEQSARQSASALATQDAQLERAAAAYNEIQQEAAQTTQALTRLQGVVRGQLLTAFREQQQRVTMAGEAFRRNSEAAQRYARQIRAVAEPSASLVRSFGQTAEAANRARQAFRQQQTVLGAIRRVLRETGGDLEQFVSRQQRVAAALERGEQSFREYATQSERAAQAARRLGAEQTRSATQAERQVRATSRLGVANVRAGQATRGLAGAMRRFYGDTRTALSFTQRIRSEVLSLVAAYAGLFAAIRGFRGIVDAFRTIETAQNRLNVVFRGDQNQIAQTLDFIRRTASRLGIQFGVLALEFTKFAVATQGTVLAGEATRRIFTAVAEAGRVQNLSLDQIQGTFLALTQIVSKGVVTMEELRRQLGDRLPGAIQIMAAALNITVAELIKLVETGNLSADVLADFADELQRRFGATLPTALESLNAQIGRFENAVFEAFRRIGQGGAIEGFGELFENLAETLQSAQFLTFLDNLGVAIAGLTSALAGLAGNFDLVVIAITTFIGFRLAPFVAVIAGSFLRWRGILRLTRIRLNAFRRTMVATSATMATAATATRGFTGALRGLLSATGIGLLITGIGAALGTWVTRTDEAVEAMVRYESIVDRVRNAIDKANGSIVEFRDQIENLTETEVRSELAGLGEEFGELISDIEKFRLGIRQAAGPFAGQDAPIIVYTQAIAGLLAQLRNGEITLETFGGRLDELGRDLGVSEDFRKIGDTALGFANRIDELNTRQQTLQNTLTALTGDLAAAEDAFNELGGAVAEVAAEDDAARLLNFHAALARMEKLIPELSRELEELKRSADLDAAREQALGLVRSYRDLVDVLNIYNRARRSQQIDRLFGGRDVRGLVAAARLLQQLTPARGPALAQQTVGLRDRVQDQIGEAAFEQFSDRQQAVLLAIEQLFGALPQQLRDALKEATEEGTTIGVERALRNLGPAMQGAGAPAGFGGLGADIFERGRIGFAPLIAAEERRLELVKRRRAEEREARLDVVRGIQEQETETRRRVGSLLVEANQRQLIRAGLEDQVEIEKAVNDARRENANLSEQDERNIRRFTQERLDGIRQERREQEALERSRQRAGDRAAAVRTTQQRIAGLLVEANQRQLIRAGLEDQVEIEKAVNEARRENADLSEQDERNIRQFTQERLDGIRQERREQEALQRSRQRAGDRAAAVRTTQQRIAGLLVEANQRELIRAGLEDQVEIEKAVNQARRENAELSEQDERNIRRFTQERLDGIRQERREQEALQRSRREVQGQVAVARTTQQRITGLIVEANQRELIRAGLEDQVEIEKAVNQARRENAELSEQDERNIRRFTQERLDGLRLERREQEALERSRQRAGDRAAAARTTQQRITGLIVEANQRQLIRAGLEDQVEIEKAVNEARRENAELSEQDERNIRRFTQERLDGLRLERREQEALQRSRQRAGDRAAAVRATQQRIAGLLVEANQRELIRAGLEDQVEIEKAVNQARRENAELSEQDERNIRRFTQERLDGIRQERREQEALQRSRREAQGQAAVARTTQQRITGLIVEANQRELIRAGLEDQVEIEKAVNQARRENAELSEQDERNIRRFTQERLDGLRSERREQEALQRSRQRAGDRAAAVRTTQQRIAELLVEANQRELIRAGLEDQVEIEKAVNQARRENAELSEQDERNIRQFTQERLDGLRLERREQEALQRSRQRAGERAAAARTTQQRITGLIVEANQRELIRTGLEDQVEIEKAVNQARRENAELSEQDERNIRQFTQERLDGLRSERREQEALQRSRQRAGDRAAAARTTQQRITGLIVEVNQRELIRAGLEDQVEIEKAVNEARRENAELSEQDERNIRRFTQERLDGLRLERREQEALQRSRQRAGDRADAARTTQQRITGLIVEANQRQLIRAGLEDQVEIEKAVNEARRENAELSEQDERNIRRFTQERLDGLRLERREQEALQRSRQRAGDRASAARTTRQRIAGLIVEVNQRELIRAGLEDQVEIEKAINEARRENAELSEQDERNIRQFTQERLDGIRRERREQEALQRSRRQAEDRATIVRTTQQRIAGLIVEANHRELIRAGLEDQVEIERAVNQARRENAELSEQDERNIRRFTQERLDGIRQERREREALQRSRQRAEDRAAASEASQQRINALLVEGNQQVLIESGLRRQVLIEQALAAARRENVNLTAEQAALIEQLVGENFEQERRLRERQEAERRVNDLLSLRSALQQEIAAIEKTGLGTDRLTGLQEQIQGINVQIREASSSFLEMLEALNSMDPAILALISRMRQLATAGQDAGLLLVTFS